MVTRTGTLRLGDLKQETPSLLKRLSNDSVSAVINRAVHLQATGPR